MVQAIMRYNSFNYIAHIGSFMCDFLKEIKIHLCSDCRGGFRAPATSKMELFNSDNS